MEAKAAFLAELTALTKKHGLVIYGCGCCGSPSVDPAPNDVESGLYVFDNEYQGQLLFLSPSDEYHWAQYAPTNPST